MSGILDGCVPIPQEPKKRIKPRKRIREVRKETERVIPEHVKHIVGHEEFNDTIMRQIETGMLSIAIQNDTDDTRSDRGGSIFIGSE